MATVVAFAGFAASFAAGLSLWQQRDRELLHSEEIQRLAAGGLKWADGVDRRELERLNPLQEETARWRLRQGRIAHWLNLSEWKGYRAWLGALERSEHVPLAPGSRFL